MSKQVEKIKELIAKRESAKLGGGEKAIEKQHARGKYTARERIDMLVDEGSFEEYDMFKLHRCHNFGMEKKQYLGDGVVAGSATIDGRLVYVYAQDFTVNGGSLSETMSAEQVSEILNEYFTEMEPIVAKHNGIINKFIGDAVMAIFGEPIQDKNHALNAVRCGYEMLVKVKELQRKWASEGKPKIDIGVGINTGEVFVGNRGGTIWDFSISSRLSS